MRTIFIIILLAFTYVFPFSSAVAQEVAHPVKQLRALYENDGEFRLTVDQALHGVQQLPGGEQNPWKGKDAEDLFSFFNEWYSFLPNTQNGLDRIMHFSLLYYNNPDGLKMVREEPGLSWTRSFVEARGKYMDTEASLSNLEAWLNASNISNDEFESPPDGFKSFNEYFIRDLKPGARPIDSVTNDAVVVSPADCVLNMIDNDITANEKIPLKGRMALNINELLGHSEFAKQFIGGTAMACFLLPDSYHHYHSPLSGMLVESREHVGEQYFGLPDLPGMVNRGNPGYGQDFSVFEQFIHGYFVIKTPNHGYVAMIPVGLNTIGSVVFESPYKAVNKDDAVSLYKGEKLGHFKYGGSLVILVFEPNRLSAVKTRLGQQIGVLK